MSLNDGAEWKLSASLRRGGAHECCVHVNDFSEAMRNF